MTLDQFNALLERYGSKSEHWPATERAAAEILLKNSPQAAATLAEADRIDRFMRTFDPAGQIGPDAVVRLSNTVLARLPAEPVRRHPWWRAALDRLCTALGAEREWGPRVAVSAAAAAVLGVLAGGLLPTSTMQASSAVEMLAMTTYSPLDER